jgi:hypothetical protein
LRVRALRPRYVSFHGGPIMMEFFQLLPELLDAMLYALVRELRQLRSGDWVLLTPLLIAYAWVFADAVRAVVKNIHHKGE